jgi:DNA-binding transcriptional LysR family regulator
MTLPRMELHDLDLNLLLVLHHLLAERRVATVAEQLGVSQPAVSNSLARLRKLLGDDLFLRTPRGMVPTPYAEQLAVPVGQALKLLHGALNQRHDFEPATCTRTFTIGMTDIGEIVFLPALLERLAELAPQVTLATVRHPAVNLKDGMEAGQIDLAIGLLPQLQAGFFQRRLFSQRYVSLFRQGHALDLGPGGDGAQTPLDRAAYAAADHVAVLSPGTGHGQIDDDLQRAGLMRRVRLRVPHFVAIGHILARSDLVATVPERLAAHLREPFHLATRPLPVPLPDIAINLFWHAQVHRDAANQWLRGVLVELFGITAHPSPPRHAAAARP